MSLKSLIKKVIPRNSVGRLKGWIETLDERIIPLFAWSGVSASLYYVLFSRKFDREHRAVLKGRLAYYASLTKIGKSSALLRRNTHRLEKGLIMRPRRAVFAQAYIMETVECYATAVDSQSLCDDELRWATDVLTEYFDVVHDTPLIERSRASFMAAKPAGDLGDLGDLGGEARAVPRAHKHYPSPGVTTEALQQLFTRRRSVRWFLDQQVPDAMLREAINLASLAPSACNRQPYEFYVVNDASRAAQVAGYAMGTTGFADNIPCLVAVVGDLNAYPAERDRHCIYIDGSLAAMQFMLALETMGLSSCPINWPDIESREQMLENDLQLHKHQRTVMLIAVGYADPDGGVPYSQKKSDAVLTRSVN